MNQVNSASKNSAFTALHVRLILEKLKSQKEKNDLINLLRNKPDDLLQQFKMEYEQKIAKTASELNIVLTNYSPDKYSIEVMKALKQEFQIN
jgi:hypothetical protein